MLLAALAIARQGNVCSVALTIERYELLLEGLKLLDMPDLKLNPQQIALNVTIPTGSQGRSALEEIQQLDVPWLTWARSPSDQARPATGRVDLLLRRNGCACSPHSA